jgi:hypothetical protein
MRRLIFRLSALIFAFAIVPLAARELTFTGDGSNAVLVELYSSEGCSSCPPAEAWMSTLKTSPELWKTLFPVAFHVDYWDELGWPDRFAKPAYTQRQRDYAAQLGQDSVYTPEFVTGGREWRGWFHGDRNPSASMATSGELILESKNDGTNVSATYRPKSPGLSQCSVHFALLGVNILSNVQGGENGGRQLRHDFVVLDFASRPLTKADGFQSHPVSLQSSTGDPAAAIVAWVSTPEGAILQVTGGWLKPSALSAGSSVEAGAVSEAVASSK